MSNAIYSTLEEYNGVFFSSWDKHIDYLVSRQHRDKEDSKNLYKWYIKPSDKKSYVLAIGIVGNSELNWHQAE